MRSHRKLKSVILMLWVLVLPAMGSSTQIIAKLKSQYGAKRASGDVDLTIYWAIREKTDHQTGSFMWDGNRFRAELGATTVVGDGQKVWQYHKTTNQLIIQKFSTLDTRTLPQALVGRCLGYAYTSKDSAQFLRLEAHPNESDGTRAVVLLVDKKSSKLYALIRSDASDNISTYRFSNFSTTPRITSKSFSFTPPAGAEIMDKTCDK